MLLLFRDKLALLVLENFYNTNVFVRVMINDDTTRDEIAHELFPVTGSYQTITLSYNKL